MTEGTDAAVVIRDFVPGDEPDLVDLYERCFGITITVPFWRWRFLECPEPTDTHIIEVDGAIVGHTATQYFDTWVAGERMRVAKGCDLMIAPEFRGRRLYLGVTERWRSKAGNVPLGLHFPLDVSVAITRRHGVSRSRLLGRLPAWVAWTSKAGVRSSNARVPGPVASAIAVAGNLVRRLPQRTSVEEVTSFAGLEDELDALAERSSQIADCVRIRDACYLRWRWLEHPDKKWRLLVARDRASTLRGFVVFTGSRRARIVDVLAEDSASFRALVAGAVRRLARDGAPLVTMELNDPRPWVGPTLKRLGMLPRGRGPQVAVTPLACRLGPAPGELDGWFITAGDTDMV